jgi:Uma2 family endonuclease
MATATLKKSPPRPQISVPRRVKQAAVHPSQAFFMPAGSMTLAEFRQWTYSDDFPTTGDIAYIGKEIFIDMSPERIDSHGSPKVEIFTTLGSFIRKKKKGRVFFDRTRIVNEGAEISNEPEAFFVSWETLKSGAIRKVQTPDGDDFIEFEGTPDWIMEIVSKSSVTKDTKKLRKRYHKAGIGEYWLIDARGEEVDFQILIHHDDDYVQAAGDGDWQVSKVFGKKFRLRRIKDELGDVDYQLDVK